MYTENRNFGHTKLKFSMSKFSIVYKKSKKSKLGHNKSYSMIHTANTGIYCEQVSNFDKIFNVFVFVQNFNFA